MKKRMDIFSITVKTEQQRQYLTQGVKRARRTVKTMMASPRVKQPTPPFQAWG